PAPRSRIAREPRAQWIGIDPRAAHVRASCGGASDDCRATPCAGAQERRVKLAFYGSSLLSSWWNGAATYYRGLLRDLASRGYDITFYEPDAYERQQHRVMEPQPCARSVVY